MKRKMWVAVLAVVSLFSIGLKAQSVDNAKKMFYYERYNTAKEELQKIIAANPTNVDAHYWLINTLIQMSDKSGAKAATVAAVTATNNAPWIQVVQGQLDLIEGNKAAAKSKFEAAITVGDKKTLPGILNAIGRANGSVGISQSEPDYAIEKLKLAAQKDAKNADIYVNMGDCYRRKLDGGAAVTAYMDALRLDPNNALAYYRMGQIYQTQDNCAPMKENYTNALAKDPNFMAAWRELFDVYGSKESKCYDKEQAKTYLDKYIASTDQGIETDKIRMRFCYYNDDYNCALSEIEKMQTKYGADTDIDLYRYKAFVYRDMKDSIKSRQSFADYFAKEKDPSRISYKIYIRAAEVASKVAGAEAEAIQYYEKSIAIQPDARLNIPSFIAVANLYDKLKDFNNAALYHRKVVDNKEVPSATNLFMSTVGYYKASQYEEGAKMGRLYAEKFPTDYRGNFWAARNLAQIDSTGQLGTAVPEYEKFIVIAEADKVKNKNQLVEAYKYVFVYKANIQRDMVGAKTYLDKLKEIDATNTSIPDFEAMLSGRRPTPPPTPKPAVPATTPTKPGTTPAAGTKPTTGAAKPTTPAPKTGAAAKPVAKPVKKVGAAKK